MISNVGASADGKKFLMSGDNADAGLHDIRGYIDKFSQKTFMLKV